MTLFDISIILVLLSFLPLTIGIVGLWITAIRFAIFQIWEDNQDGQHLTEGIIPCGTHHQFTTTS